ncbi:LEPR-XLL domain-containing protein [bacterium]|nr:LEPR-XLL domain-containing protein [bacterium]
MAFAKSRTSRRRVSGRAARLSLEPLEPRVLLSAVPLGVADWIEQGPRPMVNAQVAIPPDNAATGPSRASPSTPMTPRRYTSAPSTAASGAPTMPIPTTPASSPGSRLRMSSRRSPSARLPSAPSTPRARLCSPEPALSAARVPKAGWQAVCCGPPTGERPGRTSLSIPAENPASAPFCPWLSTWTAARACSRWFLPEPSRAAGACIAATTAARPTR